MTLTLTLHYTWGTTNKASALRYTPIVTVVELQPIVMVLHPQPTVTAL